MSTDSSDCARPLSSQFFYIICGTYATTKATFNKLDTFHKRQLRSLLSLKWTDKVSNTGLYSRTHSQPLSIYVTRACWNLFVYILRCPDDIPANVAMRSYFQPSSKQGYRDNPPASCMKTYLLHTKHTNIEIDHCYSHSQQTKTLKNSFRPIAVERKGSR